MGCWGITALESDGGLDALDTIRRGLSADGNHRLEDLTQVLKSSKRDSPPSVKEAASHSSFVALAEIVVKYLDRDFDGLDYGDEESRFSAVRSLTASKPALLELRDYLVGTLDTCRRRAEQTDEAGQYRRKWDGWFKENDWKGWQRHMEGLVSRLDGLLSVPGDEVQIYQSGQAQTEEFTEGSGPVVGPGPLF